MERVLSDGVTSGQAQCFIDLTTIREDLTYSASLLNHVLNCRISAGRSAGLGRDRQLVSLPFDLSIDLAGGVERPM
jgi:hypothetical protein